MRRRPLNAHPGILRLLAWLAASSLRLLGRTWRVSFEGRDPVAAGITPNIAGIWHRDFVIATYVFRDLGYGVPVSRSRDGDFITAVLGHLGYIEPPRGSSSKGGAAALRRLVRLVQAGHTVSLLTDGPRGPARESKTGIITLARLTQVPITPLSFSANPCLRFGSWDKTLLPLPFARVTGRYGEPLAIPASTQPDEEHALCHELDSRPGHP